MSAQFDKGSLSASVDAGGIAWVLWPGPPAVLHQLVEVDKAGRPRRWASALREDLLMEPIFKAGSCHWRLSVAWVGDGPIKWLGIEALAEIACSGINAISARFPNAFQPREG